MAAWREFIKKQLLKRDAIFSRPPGQFSIGFIKLRRAKERGLSLSMIVDGGASVGGYCREVREIYPEAKVLCIEPRDDAQPSLRAMGAELGGITIAQTLVSDKPGESVFYEHLDQSSMLADARGGFGQKISRPVDTIDNLIAKNQLPPPDFIKLDLQGAELMALAGATESLKSAQAVLLEVSFMEFYRGQPLALEVMEFMKERGFRLYDVFALTHRPLDGALAQGDFFFLREGHALMKDSRWDTKG